MSPELRERLPWFHKQPLVLRPPGPPAGVGDCEPRHLTEVLFEWIPGPTETHAQRQSSIAPQGTTVGSSSLPPNCVLGPTDSQLLTTVLPDASGWGSDSVHKAPHSRRTPGWNTRRFQQTAPLQPTCEIQAQLFFSTWTGLPLIREPRCLDNLSCNTCDLHITEICTDTFNQAYAYDSISKKL